VHELIFNLVSSFKKDTDLAFLTNLQFYMCTAVTACICFVFHVRLVFCII